MSREEHQMYQFLKLKTGGFYPRRLFFRENLPAPFPEIDISPQML